jgi:hypothetical protein
MKRRHRRIAAHADNTRREPDDEDALHARLLRLVFGTLFLAIWAIPGCAGGTRPPGGESRPTDPAKSAWSSIDVGHYRFQFTPLTSLGNTGLQLPVASPDGRWVAALSSPNTLALDPDAAVTGRTISDVTLMLYSTATPASPPRTVAIGAVSPVWTPDGKQLIAVAYDRSAHCGLIIYELATGQSRRLEIGLSHIVTLAISPQGRQLAMAGFADTAEQARLYVYNLETQRLTPLTPPEHGVWQITPMWISEQALMYYGRVGSDTGLLGAKSDGATPHSWLAKIALPANAAEALRSQAGISLPLSPDGHWLAMYDQPDNRVVLHNLDDLRSWPLDPGSQSGCWAQTAQTPRFVYAADRQLLVSSPKGDSHALAARAFLPLWCHPQGTQVLLLAPGRQEWTFELLRMQITPSP